MNSSIRKFLLDQLVLFLLDFIDFIVPVENRCLTNAVMLKTKVLARDGEYNNVTQDNDSIQLHGLEEDGVIREKISQAIFCKGFCSWSLLQSKNFLSSSKYCLPLPRWFKAAMGNGVRPI